jgi:hypothetical protein
MDGKETMDHFFGQSTPIKSHTGCWCRKCLDEYDNSLPKIEGEYHLPQTSRMMVLCQICGCKRCPHATDHNLKCTESNDPGQEGSVYK